MFFSSQRITEVLRQGWRAHPRLVAWGEKTMPSLEKFLIAGPTLVGFALGLLRHSPGEVHFETGFQSLVFFVAYLAALTVVQTLDSLFFSSWPPLTGLVRSLLAVLYIALTMRQFVQWRTGAPVILPAVARLRVRLGPVIDDGA